MGTENNSIKYLGLLFSVVTFLYLSSTGVLTGFVIASDNKLELADKDIAKTLRAERDNAIVKIERQIEKLDDRVGHMQEKLGNKIDNRIKSVRQEQKEFRKEQQLVNIKILDVLDTIKKRGE